MPSPLHNKRFKQKYNWTTIDLYIIILLLCVADIVKPLFWYFIFEIIETCVTARAYPAWFTSAHSVCVPTSFTVCLAFLGAVCAVISVIAS